MACDWACAISEKPCTSPDRARLQLAHLLTGRACSLPTCGSSAPSPARLPLCPAGMMTLAAAEQEKKEQGASAAAHSVREGYAFSFAASALKN